MNLFSRIPDRFFSILSSPLKEFYSDILFFIYDEYSISAMGVKREDCVRIITSYIEEVESDSLDTELMEDIGEAAQSPRDRASMVLRKLEDTGWIEIETFTDYTQYVNLTDYAIKILDVLKKIRDGYEEEFQGYVFDTYNNLYSEGADKHPDIILEKVYDSTYSLINNLKSLYSSIKTYTERILEEKEASEVLSSHFIDYKSEVIDKSYHRLKTSDNVSKYRVRILRKISDWERNNKLLDRIAKGMVERERYKSIDDAKEGIIKTLNFIQEGYRDMGRLMEEIDKRNAQYTRASLNQVRHALYSNRDTRGQLAEVLAWLSGYIKGNDVNFKDPPPEEIDAVHSIYSQGYIDDSSLYKPRKTIRVPQFEVIEGFELDEALKNEKVISIKEKMQKSLTRDRVNAFVMDVLKERASIRASEMDIKSVEDFIRLIYIFAFSQSKRVGYRVDILDERVEGEMFSFPEAIIRRL
ncbi:MAG: DUF5716 family protein [Thermoanaerobacteraceae bacterium]|nr:DUF5716 family protein [Thermoanaerobacteraceae bacterium]